TNPHYYLCSPLTISGFRINGVASIPTEKLEQQAFRASRTRHAERLREEVRRNQRGGAVCDSKKNGGGSLPRRLVFQASLSRWRPSRRAWPSPRSGLRGSPLRHGYPRSIRRREG